MCLCMDQLFLHSNKLDMTAFEQHEEFFDEKCTSWQSPVKENQNVKDQLPQVPPPSSYATNSAAN